MKPFKFRRLNQWKTGGTDDEMELEIPLPRTATGMVRRWCPNDDCRPRRFQLGDLPDEVDTAERPEGARRPPGTSSCTCPYCGRDADDADYTAPEDLEAALEKVKWAVEEDTGLFLDDLVDEFNCSINKGGGNILGIGMTSSFRSKSEPSPWREDLLRLLECGRCGRAYGVYAIGFFCPDCGAANLATHFRKEVGLILSQVDIADQAEAEGSKELAFRLLGNAHEDVVTAFETYLKSVFFISASERFSGEEMTTLGKKELYGNPFQNLDRAERIYSKLGLELFVGINDSDRQFLALNFEKRHVVGHNLGIADEKYVEVASDETIGETVSLLGDEIEAFSKLCLKVIQNLEKGLPELQPHEEME